MDGRRAVQLALTEVLQGLASKRIEPLRAGKLLYGIQIAANLLHREYGVFASSFVQSLTTSEEGDELARERFIHYEGDKHEREEGDDNDEDDNDDEDDDEDDDDEDEEEDDEEDDEDDKLLRGVLEIANPNLLADLLDGKEVR